MRFLSNFGCKIIFMRSVNFWHRQDSNLLFKGSIGHVTSQVAYSVLKNRKKKLAAVVFHFVAVVQEHDTALKFIPETFVVSRTRGTSI